jgi:hypothetical protein
MSQKGNKGKDNTPNKSVNTPRKDSTPDKGKNAAVASKTYQQKEKEKAKTPEIRIGGVRYEVPNQRVGQSTFKDIVAANPTKSLQDLKELVADKGYRLNEKAKDYFSANKDVLNQPKEEESTEVAFSPGVDNDGDGLPDIGTGTGTATGLDPYEWQARMGIQLGKYQKEAQTESETIRGKSLEEVAKIQRGQSDYAQDAETKRSFYSDDSEERWRKFASTADKEKAIEVQKIVAAGLRDVAEIEGGYSLKGIQAKGEADKAVMGIRAQADKDISRMDNTSRMYSLLGLAFG